MLKTNELKQQLQQQINHLPWATHSISLLLDGINIKNLLHRFYTKYPTVPFEVLYLQTPFAELSDISPCLIKLDNPNNPHLQAYLDNLQNDWGYILVSDHNWQQQIDHLRNLIIVTLPDSQQTILKLADPMVAKALFSLAEQQQHTDLFGPFSQIYTTDILDNQLNHYQRPETTILPLQLPYQLSQAQDKALKQIDIMRSNLTLYQHMQNHFPEFLSHYSESSRRQAIGYILEEAEAKGYNCEISQAYYLNIYGYLGDIELADYPQISQLIDQKNIDSLKVAAKLAKQQAIVSQG